MTIQEMHLEFKISLDKVDSQAYPEFLDGEIDYYLNEAQDRIVKQRYGTNNIYRKGFEESQKRTDDLKNLIRSKFCSITQSTAYTSLGFNVYEANLSVLYNDKAKTVLSTDEYLFYLKSMAEACVGSCCATNKVRLIQQDDLTEIAADPFNRPTPKDQIVFFENGNLMIWTDDTSVVQNLFVTFLKIPVKMDLGTYGGTETDCELSEHMHKEVVQMAVGIALENIESQRTESQQVINVNKVE